MNIKRIMHGRIRVNGETVMELGETSLGVLAQQAVKFIIESTLKADEARTISIDFSSRRFNDDGAVKEISVDDLLELQQNIGAPELDKITLDDSPCTMAELTYWRESYLSFRVAEQAVRDNQMPSAINLTHQMIQYLSWLKARRREARDESIP